MSAATEGHVQLVPLGCGPVVDNNPIVAQITPFQPNIYSIFSFFLFHDTEKMSL